MLEKIKEKEDIDEILDVIKKFDEFGQYNILEYIKTLGQVFITVTEKEKVKNFENGKIFDISNY